MSLFAELRRRKVFQVGAAYLVVAWALIEVAATLAPLLNLPEWTPRLITFVLMLGFPVALVLAWAIEATPDGLRVEAGKVGSKRLYAVAAVLAAAAVVWFVRGSPGLREEATAADPRSIAVLPFANMSDEPGSEYFADGLSEEILNALVTITDLRVTGRTSSFQFKGRNEDLRRIGEQLGVASVVEGSVRRAGGQVRITAQLVRATDGFHLWSASYDRDVKDTFQVQLDIAHNVARALDVVLDDAQHARMRESGVRDVDAFIAYQKAQELYLAAHDEYIAIDQLHAGYAEFERAIALEPRFGMAYYLRTDLYAHLLGGDTAPAQEQAELHQKYLADLAEAARLTPVPLDRALIEVDRILVSDDWTALPRAVDAVYAMPGCGTPVWFDVVAAFVDPERFLERRQRLMECDPLNRGDLQQVAMVAILAGQPELALRTAQMMNANADVSGIYCTHVAALLLLGRIEEARREAAVPEPRTREFCELLIGGFTGDAARARSALQRWLGDADAATHGSAEFRIVAHAIAGDREGADAVAASLDRNPIGPMMLALAAFTCACGAPFDIERTPRFRARLAEAGWSWPTPDMMRYKTRDR